MLDSDKEWVGITCPLGVCSVLMKSFDKERLKSFYMKRSGFCTCVCVCVYTSILGNSSNWAWHKVEQTATASKGQLFYDEILLFGMLLYGWVRGSIQKQWISVSGLQYGAFCRRHFQDCQPPVTWGDAGILVHSAGGRDCWWGSDLLCRLCRDLSYKALVLRCWSFPTAVICLSVDGEEQGWIMWILFEDRDRSPISSGWKTRV